MDYSESDREFWEEELADFVPQRVFDAHCHLFDAADMRPDAPATTRTYADLKRCGPGDGSCSRAGG